MAQQGETLAKKFGEANGQFIQAVEKCSEQAWKSPCAGEGWSVGVTAHHVAQSMPVISGAVLMIATEQPLPPLTPEWLEQQNAEHAKTQKDCTAQETLKMLRDNGAAAMTTLKGLSDEQLGRSASFFGQEMTAQGLAENVLLGHTMGHLESIRAAAKA